jgi:hypothetical protein
MNLEIMQSRNTEAVREYVQKKFKSFNGWTYRDSTAKRKCLEYYIAAAEWNKSVVAGAYFTTFKKSFPISEASALQEQMERAARGPMKVEHHQWIEMQEEKLEAASQALEQLKIWKEGQDYQEGEGFFLRMKSLIH